MSDQSDSDMIVHDAGLGVFGPLEPTEAEAREDQILGALMDHEERLRKLEGAHLWLLKFTVALACLAAGLGVLIITVAVTILLRR